MGDVWGWSWGCDISPGAEGGVYAVWVSVGDSVVGFDGGGDVWGWDWVGQVEVAKGAE